MRQERRRSLALDCKKEIKIPIITEILDVRDIDHVCKVTDIIQIVQEICKIIHCLLNVQKQ